jgi:hypothetical protein
MADLPMAEIEWRIALLPPISRGVHLDGPALHAQRLLELWKVDEGDDDVPLGQAFRLLAAPAIEGAIWRIAAAKEHFGDAHLWTFPSLVEELLPELRRLLWQDMLAGALLTTAIKGERGKQHRTVLPAELPRLKPDWELSRLVAGDRDEYIDVRVRMATPPANKKTSYSGEKLKAATEAIAKLYPPGARPTFKEFQNALQARLPGVTRAQARAALDYAPQLRGRRGYRGGKSPA